VMTSVNSSELQVSVIVPTYNAARTLAATLASATAQTVREIEIIVVDDGSTDATAHVLSQSAATEPRLRVITQVNAGVSTARNAGIAAARASIVAFLDADDLWPAHHLETHLAALAEDPVLDLSFGAARYIDANGTCVGASRPQLEHLDAETLLVSNPTTTTSTWVARRSAFARAGLFDVVLKRSEDQAWLVRAALAGLGIRGTDRSVVDYRISNTGLASDLTGMRHGFVTMLDRLSIDHSAFVEKNRASALAAEDLYLARRALQLSLPVSVARNYLALAFREAPLRLLSMPRATCGVLLRLLAQPLLARPLQPV
jgi:hypothetical protein